MAACEQAVELEPDHGGYRDSHGLARALTGDYPGAIVDFGTVSRMGAEKWPSRRTDSSTSRLDPNVASKPESVQRRTIETLAGSVGFWEIRVGVIFVSAFGKLSTRHRRCRPSPPHILARHRRPG